MSTPPLHTHAEALLKRATAAALIGDGNSSFWRGYAKGLKDLLGGFGALAATKDDPHCQVLNLGDVVHLEITDAKGAPQGTISARPMAHFGSAAELARSSLAQRGELPAGFESFTCEQMHQFYVSHGVEMALEYAAALQREARLIQHENTVVRPGADADHEGADLAVDTDDGAGKHAASLEHTELPVRLAEGSIVLPAPQPLGRWHWLENRFFRYAPDGSGLTYGRHYSDCCAPYWIGSETRVDPLGARRWETGNIHYVPDDFGTLVEVPR